MTRDLDAVLASIDGALADDELPDAMRWSPDPAAVDAPHPFDGRVVYVGDEVGVNDPRSWLREFDTDHPRGRGLPVDHLIFDELYLVDPAHRAEVEEQRRREQARVVDLVTAGAFLPEVAVRAAEDHARAEQALRELFDGIADAMRPLVEAANRWAEQTGKQLATVVEEWRRALAAGQLDRPIPPPALRVEDPWAYALQLRQARGTGPDRQVQRQHRPRRHR